MIIHKIEELISESENNWEYVYGGFVSVPESTEANFEGVNSGLASILSNYIPLNKAAQQEVIDAVKNQKITSAGVDNIINNGPGEGFNSDTIVAVTKAAEQSAKEAIAQSTSKLTQAASNLSDNIPGLRSKAEEGMREFKTLAGDISNKNFAALDPNPLVERVRGFCTVSPYIFYAIAAAVPLVFAGVTYAGIKIDNAIEAKRELDKAEAELAKAKTKSQKKVAMKKIASIGAQGLVLSKK